MKKETAQGAGTVRMLFELTRDDNPRLFDDLIRFNKGTKRVNRLRYLAHEGLLAQNWALVPTMAGATQASKEVMRGPGSIDKVAAGMVIQAFDSPTAGADG